MRPIPLEAHTVLSLALKSTAFFIHSEMFEMGTEHSASVLFKAILTNLIVKVFQFVLNCFLGFLFCDYPFQFLDGKKRNYRTKVGSQDILQL